MRDPLPGLKLSDLTDKQREVLSLIADNRTSKEISGYLGITESAVNQRIEAIRARLGGVPRAQLARLYRQLVQQETADFGIDPTCKTLTADIIQLTETSLAPDSGGGSQGGHPSPDDGDSPVIEPAGQQGAPRVVPAVFDGEHGTLNRIVAMVVIAVGLLVLLLVGLGVAQALNRVV
ncbi:MAG: helix-turn-helix transcriptional regulator [Sphingomonadales bacterium]|nr:helix-turn-helix transcriptional regulator [Sphingomonadales bacterium]